jgi:hypothetical protein
MANIVTSNFQCFFSEQEKLRRDVLSNQIKIGDGVNAPSEEALK